MSPEAVWANLRSMAAVVSGSYPTKFEVIADFLLEKRPKKWSKGVISYGK